MPASDEDLRALPLEELHREHTTRYHAYKQAADDLSSSHKPSYRLHQRYGEARRRAEATNAELMRRDREAMKAFYKKRTRK